MNSRNPTDVNLASVDLNLLVALRALVEEVSVTKAASRVGVSQPAMSHSLRRLRRLLGDEIILRRNGVSELTSRAQALIGPLREILLKTEDLVRGASFDPLSDDRTVTMALTSGSIRVMGNRILHVMYDQAPNMHLRLRNAWADIDAMYNADRVDVALMPHTIPTRYPREHLYNDDWVVLSGQNDVTEENVIEMLSTRPHVLYDTGNVDYAYDMLQAHGIHVDTRATVSDSLVMADLVARGPFLALYREQVARSLPDSMGLSWVRLPFATGSNDMDMVWSPWLSDDAFKVWFRGVLRSCAPD
jgi:DNA-binding transcriptional LysR family regulator